MEDVKKTNDFLTNFAIKYYLKKAVEYYKKSKFERSISKLKEVFKFQPNNNKALKVLGLILLEENKLDKALDLFNRSIEIEDNIKTLKEKGIVLIKLERYSEAIEIFEQILKKDNFDKMSNEFKRGILNNKGICHYQLKQLDENSVD